MQVLAAWLCAVFARTSTQQSTARVLLLAVCALVATAGGAATPEHVRFRQVGTAQGLSQVSAVDVLQDHLGFLWIGTQDGLNRYDGYEFQVFRHRDDEPDSLGDNYVLALAEDAAGDIWVGTQNGLNRLDRNSGRFQRFAVGSAAGELRDGLVIGLLAAPNGGMYVSSRRGGVQRFDRASGRFEAVPGLPAFVRRQKLLLASSDGRLLISNDAELWRVSADGSSREQLAPGALAAGSQYLVATAMRGGGYALGTSQQGLVLIDATGAVREQYRAGPANGDLPDDGIRALHVDAAGRLWVGTTRGLARLEDDGRFSVWKQDLSTPYGLPGDRVVALAGDQSGLLWIGTWTGGLARFDPQTESFRVLRRRLDGDSGLPTNAVVALAEESGGGLWAGMIDRGGLARLAPDGRVLQLLRSDSGPEPRLQSDDITALLAEPRGLWVGYSRGGADLRRRDGSVLRFPPAAAGGPMPDTVVQSFMLDRDGTLWLAVLGGSVHSLCASCSEFRRWEGDPTGAKGPLGDNVNQILQSRDGRIWFAVRRGGLSWYVPEQARWGVLSAASGPDLAPPHESLTALFEDSRGVLWFGTQGGGMCAVRRGGGGDPTGLDCYSESQGLASGMVGAITESSDGRLWVSTTRGLCRMEYSDHRFECMGDRDPALGVDFFIGSGLRDARGGLHFGSPEGLVSIPDPTQVANLRRETTLALTELRIGNRPVQARAGGDAPALAIENANRLVLKHDEDLVTIGFAALDFRRSAGLRYRYQLAGRDAEWIETDAARRVATYTGLPTGKFRFLVEAWDGDQRIAERELAVEVLPPPWLSGLARLGYALFLAGLLAVLVWRFRVRQRERERAQDALAQSEALLKYSLWGSRGELWDADLRTGRLLRRNRLEHLEATRRAAADTLDAYTPFVHAEDRGRFHNVLIACVKGESDLFECSFRTQSIDGDWRWLLSRGRVFARDAQGRAIRMVGTTFDITELRASEAALRDSEDRLKLALWGSGDEMWDIDLVDGLVRRENPLQETALLPEMQFRHLIDYMQFIHPFDQGRLREALIAHIKGEVDHFSSSYRTRGRDGGWVWILGKGRVVSRDTQGRALRMVGTNRNVSQLKAVEEDLRRLNEELELRVTRRTEAVERANRDLKTTLDQLTRAQRQLVESEKLAALGGLVAGVAHEINTPLGVGVTAASHLQSETERLARRVEQSKMTRQDLADFLEQARQSSDLVLRNLERASQLVRSFKQVAVDQSSEQRRSIHLREYLAEILTSLRPRMKKARSQVEIECPDTLTMDTYPGALYQIIVNLVINSLVHGFGDAEDGRIRIQAKLVESEVWIDYSDDGVGMSESVRRRVFEPFFTTRRGSGGSGLGLHIVYNLATQVLRGTVECESSPGQGTHFRLVLPQIAPHAPDPRELTGVQP